MAVHLENLLLRVRDQDPAEATLAGELRPFGAERRKHLPSPTAVTALESALQVYDARQLTADNMLEHAGRAVETYARLVLHNHPENLTVFVLGGAAMVHTSQGWSDHPTADAVDELVNMLAACISRSIRAVDGCALRELPLYFTIHHAELCETLGGRLLRIYTAAAVEYYTALPPPLSEPARDPRLHARTLLMRGAALELAEP